MFLFVPVYATTASSLHVPVSIPCCTNISYCISSLTNTTAATGVMVLLWYCRLCAHACLTLHTVLAQRQPPAAVRIGIAQFVHFPSDGGTVNKALVQRGSVGAYNLLCLSSMFPLELVIRNGSLFSSLSYGFTLNPLEGSSTSVCCMCLVCLSSIHSRFGAGHTLIYGSLPQSCCTLSFFLGEGGKYGAGPPPGDSHHIHAVGFEGSAHFFLLS